ncbi:hypothetical protein B0I35DRAFT_483623 [Stachybotrys elegans]|uniref:Uncharacterized protein n=1 Tax=Stachybotrys elegans TaxID=80388 RepID=A0A8K0SGJ6_9HYPO|nr:hypothetical protein B0I35DRAFT_483623 [Stachybotrys elegans]
MITDIPRLFNEQIQAVRIKRPNQPITGIFLVGGFGGSQYLKSCIEREHPNIQVLQPNDAWGAIVNGAALSRLPHEAHVVSTSSTKHCGVEAYGVYDVLEDAGQPTKVLKDGTTRTRKITWYVAKGEDITRDQKIRLPFERELPIDYAPPNLIFQDHLIQCSDTEAPRHRTAGRDISINCTLTSNLQSVDKSRFETLADSAGNPYICVRYDLVMTLRSALMELSLEMGGEKMGSVRAKFG